MRYKIVMERDPYNERGEYMRSEAFADNLVQAIDILERAESGHVLDLHSDTPNSHSKKIVATKRSAP